MKAKTGKTSPWMIRLLVVAGAAAVYFLTPLAVGEREAFGGHFPTFAKAFSEGRASIPAQGAVRRELIPSADGQRLFLGYPPLPAILMIPFVAVFGTAFTSQIATRLVSTVSVAVFDACLPRIATTIGRPPLLVQERVALDLLFALGTATWHNAQFAGDWHLAHAITLCAMLLALLEFGGKRRPMVIGFWMLAVVLTRPTASLAGVFFLLPWVRSRNLIALGQFIVFPVAAITGIAFYNWDRFGNPLDFGYSRMFLGGMGAELMKRYGQFHPRFVPKNAFWFFLSPPWYAGGRSPALGFDPRGLGLFFASPALAFLFVSVVRHWRKALLQHALAAIVLCLIPLLAYFNTGFFQFGHRFSMDYLAILMVPVIWGMGARMGRVAYSLTALSILIQAWGILLHPVVWLPATFAPAP